MIQKSEEIVQRLSMIKYDKALKKKTNPDFFRLDLYRKKLRKAIKKYAVQDVRIELKDVMKNKMFSFRGDTVKLPSKVKRSYTCYRCWQKFVYTHELTKHKLIHKKEDEQKQQEEKRKEKELKKEKQEEEKRKEKKKQEQSRKITDWWHPKEPLQQKDSVVEQSKAKEDSPYKCETCNFKLETKEDVKSHATSKCKFYCDLCKRTYNTMHCFNIHILQHKIKKPMSKKNYTCLKCSKEFFDIIQFRSHTLLNHSKQPETDGQSTSNPKEVINNSDSQAVIAAADEGDKNDYTCELCFDLFTNAQDFNDHMEFHKQLTNGDKPLESQSKEVGFVIASSYSLAETENEGVKKKNHIRTDTNPGYEVMKANDVIPQNHYRCEICFRMFMTMEEYNNHLGENCTVNKSCVECSKKVKSNIHFFSHFSKTHPKIFICEYCFAIVKEKKEVDDHRLAHFKSFKNVCKICFKIFKSYSSFNDHVNEHLSF